MSSKLTEDSRMPFGKWAGERLADIPDEYFEWLKKQPGFKFKHPALWKWDTRRILTTPVRAIRL